MLRRLLAILLLIAGAGGVAQAQDLVGVVRDSATGTPIMGAVVSVLDARGVNVTRTVTGARGSFLLTDLGDRAATIRVVRLGFRPRVLPLPTDWSLRAAMDISMGRLPTLLETVRVTANAKCDPKRSNLEAQGLLQQARAGLLTTIVGRESNPARFVRLSYERTLLGRVDTTSPSVRIDSTTGTTSFRAVRRGADLVRLGFTADSLGTGIYFGPDAEVLLDEGFEAGYCFFVVSGAGDLVGLSFSPAASRRIGRVDVEGTLWIDSRARTLTKLEYRYVGLGRAHDELGVGGSVAYQEMPNGSVIVTEWSVRLLKDRVDSVRRNGVKVAIPRLVVSDGGAVVARATWNDGTVWRARLGAIVITAVHGGTGDVLPNATVRLRNTGYTATTDGRGAAVIGDILPGRYGVDVINPQLLEYGLTAMWDDPNLRSADSTVTRGSRTQIEETGERTTRTFIARAGDTVKYVAPMQTPAQLAATRCASGRAVIGQVRRPNGLPGDSVAVWAEGTSETVLTTPAGGFMLCVPAKYAKDEIELGGQGRGASVRDTKIKLEGPVTFVRLVLDAS